MVSVLSSISSFFFLVFCFCFSFYRIRRERKEINLRCESNVEFSTVRVNEPIENDRLRQSRDDILVEKVTIKLNQSLSLSLSLSDRWSWSWDAIRNYMTFGFEINLFISFQLSNIESLCVFIPFTVTVHVHRKEPL